MRGSLQLCVSERSVCVKRARLKRLLRDSDVWLTHFTLLNTHSEDPVQEWGEEVEDGMVYGVTLHREPACPSPSDLVGVACVQYRTLKVRRVKAAMLEHLITELLNPTCDEHDYARIFLSTYRAFTCTNTLIEMLFQREDKIFNLDNSVCVRSSLPELVRLWLDEFGEDLRDSPLYSSLRLLSLHLRHRLCFRRLAQQADTLLHTFQEEDRCAETRSEVTQVSGDETGSVLSCSARDIAEELTRLDAALFVRVVPFHCLGCVWSQRDKKENRSLAPSVRATIAQFNSVTNWVITSLLCPTSPPNTGPHTPPSSTSPRLHLRCQHSSPAHRARIIEKWISVAQECHQLRSFSSLRAILSALQSNAVYRLKKTWATVSKESLATFDHLCESFPDENCVLANREILEDSNEHTTDAPCAALGSPKLSPSSSHTSYTGGEVPYLGTYLTVLTMLDTALPDTLEGRLINFEKRRREFEVLSQIRQLQVSCSLYSLPSHTHVSSCISSAAPLSDQQSYDLSRQLEPPIDSCPGSPSWSHRLIGKKKLGLLLSSSDGSRKKTHSDQMSVSSSGSSGSEMDDVSFTLRPKSQSGSCLNVSADSSGLYPDPRCSSPARPSSQSDVSSLSSDCVSPPSSSSLSPSSSSSQAVYNKQSDICIIRVSMALHSGNVVYKSILINSQDKTSQVIQRALEKHNMENMSCNDFTLTQILHCDKELVIPDKANVFYAMCPSDSYDFVLRERWRTHTMSQSPAVLRRAHNK